MRPSRTRLYALVAVVIAAAVVAFVLTRGKGGGGKGGGAGTAAASADDPWGASTNDPASEAARLAKRNGGKGGWLAAKKGGPPVVVRGLVKLMPAGTPAAGAEVAFMNDGGENTATADGTGHYEITVASEIAWNVHARTDGAVGYPERFVPAGATPVRDLEIHPTATVTGRVLDARGAVVTDAEVSAVMSGPGKALLETALGASSTTDGTGRFELQTLPGALMVRAARGLAHGITQVPTLAPGETVDLTISIHDPGRVSGRVVDDDGKPVAGAKVLTAVTLVPGGPTEKSQVDSQEDGSFQVAVPAGSIRIEARRLGELSAARVDWMNSGGTLENIELVIGAPAALHGKVVTGAGVPVSGANVRLVAGAVYDAVTGNDGTFTVDAVAGQSYLAKIRHSAGTVERQVAAWNGEELFVMKPFGRLEVVVDRGGGAAGGELAVEIDAFLPAGESAPRTPGERRFRGNGTSITLPDLEPGLYDLTVTAPGAGSVKAPRVAIRDGEQRQVKVKLAAAVSVRGTVKSGTQPVGGAQVAIGGHTAFSDSKGRWSLPDVAAGPISLVVTKTGFNTAWLSAIAGADAGTIDIDLRAGSGVAIEGIGVVLAPAAQGAVVASVLPGGPAEGKLAPGDVIEEVGGEDVTAAAVADIVARLRGPAGSSVSLVIRRGSDTSSLDVSRKRLVVPDGTPATGLALVTRPPGRARAG